MRRWWSWLPGVRGVGRRRAVEVPYSLPPNGPLTARPTAILTSSEPLTDERAQELMRRVHRMPVQMIDVRGGEHPAQVVQDSHGRHGAPPPARRWPAVWWIGRTSTDETAVFTTVPGYGRSVVTLARVCPGPIWASIAAVLPDRGYCGNCTSEACSQHVEPTAVVHEMRGLDGALVPVAVSEPGEVVLLGPDCAVRKHVACSGDAWDPDEDRMRPCACTCHRAGGDGRDPAW